MNPQDFWNQRYNEEEYAYGVAPNAFIADQLTGLPKGSILFPAEGEGRNAVFAANLGWNSFAFDQSSSGKVKALALAENLNVSIDYAVCNALDYQAPHPMDAVAFCYFHTPESVLERIYHHLFDMLRKGGVLLIEGFSEKNLGLGSGGPQDLSMLFTETKISKLLKGFSKIEVWEEHIVLNEGKYHQGEAWVVRAIAEK